MSSVLFYVLIIGLILLLARPLGALVILLFTILDFVSCCVSFVFAFIYFSVNIIPGFIKPWLFIVVSIRVGKFFIKRSSAPSSDSGGDK